MARYSFTVEVSGDTRRKAAGAIQAIVRNWPVSHRDSLLVVVDEEA